MNFFTPVIIVIGAYLVGSIPTAYLVAKYKAGIDIRGYGSGNVGAANVSSLVGARFGLALGTFDCVVKGALPVVIAGLLGQDVAVQVAAGLAAVVGHNWSPFIGFTGGRGVATVIGIVVGLGMWWEVLILAVILGAMGWLIFKDTAFWSFVSMIALPILAFLFGRPLEVVVMSVIIGVLLLLKRATANWQMPASDSGLIRVLVYRILWDRDVSKKLEWTSRLPGT
ncbi:MAG: glycerol-3-phosphate acyltransferase [Chloroflexi bacterium]|nr:glycerol-3-phosphate acyltransferase [Chloroflexota bacterium]